MEKDDDSFQLKRLALIWHRSRSQNDDATAAATMCLGGVSLRDDDDIPGVTR